MDIKNFLENDSWHVVDTQITPARAQQLFSIDDLSLSPASQRYINQAYPAGIYRHQKEAIKRYLAGENVCLTTGTASGKSLLFYVSAIEQLVLDPAARIIAIYPMKALGHEQTNRWQTALQQAGLSVEVGRIDGNIKPITARLPILEQSQVLIFTPDIIHAWLLSNLLEPVVVEFLEQVQLIIADEIHTYSGVFGSNSAFLFRRLQHLIQLVGQTPRYICASATIFEPAIHLRKLFGVDFSLVDQTFDSSPRQQLEINLITPPSAKGLTDIANLLHHLASHTDSRFITFVDSRKQVELLSSILARFPTDEEDETQDQENDSPQVDLLATLNVLPYRSGYEAQDRLKIQERLTDGSLRGVVSTSALELGIDIPHLDTCILVGVPNSATSLFQRIGRVGRHAPGRVLVINTGDLFDRAIFADAKNFLNRPLAESTLYLENDYIQYIHALCLARRDGEHDQLLTILEQQPADEFVSSEINWPAGFLKLCNQERHDLIPVALQSMKAEAGDTPNYVFPLRDVESQFKVQLKQGPHQHSLGSLSYSQMMREAYPGAVYYYATLAYRVYRVLMRSKVVQVRKEKKYTTRANQLPTLVFPDLSSLLQTQRQAELNVIECPLQIRESINGLYERRGPNEMNYEYPLSGRGGVYFNQAYFNRNYFTTGVILAHPVLNRETINSHLLAELLCEAFLVLVPFERQDINFAADKYRITRPPFIEKGDRFVALYDQTYGSLRLSARLLDAGLLPRILQEARHLATQSYTVSINEETLAALEVIASAVQQPASPLIFDEAPDEILANQEGYERVIMPESKGLNSKRNNELFWVKQIFVDSKKGLCYQGVTASRIGSRQMNRASTILDTLSVAEVIEIPGESQVGFYNYETDQIEPDPSTNVLP